jgi:hypothetical protein
MARHMMMLRIAPLEPTSAPGDDQEVVAEHEAGGRRRPARVAVQHRDDHGHVRASDRHHEVNTEHARDARLDQERA